MLVLLWFHVGVALMCFSIMLVSFSSRVGDVLFLFWCRVYMFLLFSRCHVDVGLVSCCCRAGVLVSWQIAVTLS